MTEEKKDVKEIELDADASIHERINAIMSELHYIKKEEKKGNGQYTCVSHDAVAGAIQPLLVKYRVNLIPSVVNRIQNGNRTEIDMKFSFVNVDNPSDKFESTFVGYGIDNQDKGVGKAVSYAKKYVCLQTFMLETGDDPEKDLIDHKADDQNQPEPKTSLQKKVTQKQIQNLKELLDLQPWTHDQYLNHYKVDRFEDILESTYLKTVKKIKEIQEEKNAST